MEKKFTFEFTETEANTILNALAELPFKVSNTLIQKIIAEAQKSATPVAVEE